MSIWSYPRNDPKSRKVKTSIVNNHLIYLTDGWTCSSSLGKGSQVRGFWPKKNTWLFWNKILFTEQILSKQHLFFGNKAMDLFWVSFRKWLHLFWLKCCSEKKKKMLFAAKIQNEHFLRKWWKTLKFSILIWRCVKKLSQEYSR